MSILTTLILIGSLWAYPFQVGDQTIYVSKEAIILNPKAETLTVRKGKETAIVEVATKGKAEWVDESKVWEIVK